jgi:hypothetical protein
MPPGLTTCARQSPRSGRRWTCSTNTVEKAGFTDILACSIASRDGDR